MEPVQGEVNDVFLESLAALHQKLDFLSQSSMAQARPPAPLPSVSTLRYVACLIGCDLGG